MEKLYRFAVLIFSVFMLSSCNDRFEGDEINNIEQLKIDSVTIPQDTMEVYSTQTIKTYSNYSANCEGFYGYDYVRNGLTRNVAAYQYSVKGNCTQATRVGVNGFNFRPEEKGSYTFKFWNGKDSSDNLIWIEKTVIVQ